MDTKKTRLVLAALADVEPSLGVTEPGAIAFTAACAARAAGGKAKSVEVWLNSGIYKNSFTCA
ncbi:MAG: serine dehydratase subunit alpha family protein, partial [Clostridia bacterium]|nr:serine dehydratase subunit alpha family protein [Clostridia bacterium]